MSRPMILMHVVALSLVRMTWGRLRGSPFLLALVGALGLFYVSRFAPTGLLAP